MSLDSLLTLRLLMARNRSYEEVQPILESSRRELERADSPFRELLIEAIDGISGWIARGDRENAFRLVQLIHNLPTTSQELDSWDEAHVFQIELPSYLESEDDIERVKRLLALIEPQAART